MVSVCLLIRLVTLVRVGRVVRLVMVVRLVSSVKVVRVVDWTIHIQKIYGLNLQILRKVEISCL